MSALSVLNLTKLKANTRFLSADTTSVPPAQISGLKETEVALYVSKNNDQNNLFEFIFVYTK